MKPEVQVAFNAGLTSLDDKEAGQALVHFKQVITLDPRLAAAHYYLGICHKLQQKFPDARGNFQDALTLNDTLWRAQLELGKVYEVTYIFGAARTAYEAVRRMVPHHPDGHYHLANLEFIQGKYPEAESLYQHTLTVSPRYANAYVMLGRLQLARDKNLQKAKSFFEEAVRADSVSSQGLFWRGLAYADLGQPDKSLQDWNSLVRLHPNNPLYMFMRGYLQIELGDLDKAFTDFRRAITANPENADKFVGGQTILDKRIDLQSAARALVQKLYGFKEPDLSSMKYGFCYLLAGRYQGAMNWFMKVRTESGIYYLLKGITYEHAGMHNKALEQYSLAIEFDKELPDAYKKRAIYLMELGQFEEALADIDALIKTDHGAIIGLKLKGITYALANQCPNAISALTEFINSDSTDRESFKTRAYCYEKNGQVSPAGTDYLMAFLMGKPDQALLSRAFANLESAAKTNPPDLNSLFYLGGLLVDLGNREAGIKYLKQASKKGHKRSEELLRRLKG